MSSNRKFVIDTDGGVDDAGALILLLSRVDTSLADKNISILGVTTVFGNVGVGQATANVSRILRLVGKENVAVYKGAKGSIITQEKQFRNPEYHGNDGFGDVPSVSPKLSDHDFRIADNNETAASALIRICREHQKEITLVCLGPLTNIALALKLDSDFGSMPKNLYLMGGNLWGKK